MKGRDTYLLGQTLKDKTKKRKAPPELLCGHKLDHPPTKLDPIYVQEGTSMRHASAILLGSAPNHNETVKSRKQAASIAGESVEFRCCRCPKRASTLGFEVIKSNRDAPLPIHHCAIYFHLGMRGSAVCVSLFVLYCV